MDNTEGSFIKRIATVIFFLLVFVSAFSSVPHFIHLDAKAVEQLGAKITPEPTTPCNQRWTKEVTGCSGPNPPNYNCVQTSSSKKYCSVVAGKCQVQIDNAICGIKAGDTKCTVIWGTPKYKTISCADPSNGGNNGGGVDNGCTTDCHYECKKYCPGGGGSRCGTATDGTPKYECRVCTNTCPTPTKKKLTPTPTRKKITPTPTKKKLTPTPTKIVPSPKQPTVTSIPAPVCNSLSAYNTNGSNITPNLRSIKYGDVVLFTAASSKTKEYVKSFTFQVGIDGKYQKPQTVPAVLVNGIWQATYSYHFLSYGEHSIQVSSVNLQ